MSSIFAGHNRSSSIPVHYEVDSGLALITFMDSDGGNRLNPDSLSLLQNHLDTALADQSVRVIALRAAGPAGKAFCLGMDLDKLGESLNSSSEQDNRRAAVQAYGTLLECIGSCAKPVVALVGGPVKAGGIGLVAACDIVLASSSASFELSEVLFGLIPANVLPYLLSRRMGVQKARYLILSAKCLDGSEAQNCGLVDQCCSDESAESTVKNLLKTMMRGEPGALAVTKHFLCEAEGMERAELRHYAVDTLLELMENSAVKTALTAFANGETPPWFGRFKPQQAIFWGTHV